MSSHAASLKRREDARPPSPPAAAVPVPLTPESPRGSRAAPPRGIGPAWRWPLGAFGVAALVVLVAGAIVWAALRSASTDEPARATGDRAVELGAATVTVPAAWEPASIADARLPGVAEPVTVLAPAPGLDAFAVVLLAPHDLPAALRDLLGPRDRGRPTTLAGMPARVYSPRGVPGDRLAQLTLARTTFGLLAVACTARSESWPAAAGCAEQVRDLTAATHEPPR